MNENIAFAFGTQSDISTGRTITPLAITGSAPVIDVKINAVTMLSREIVTADLSPPSSTVLRISVEAIPVSIKTRPNHAPQQTFTRVVPQPSGAEWYMLLRICTSVLPVPSPNISTGLAARNSFETNRGPPRERTVHNTVFDQEADHQVETFDALSCERKES